MKKNTILLLAGVCTLMTGCGGTKYTNSYDETIIPGAKINYTEELKLKSKSFTLTQTCGLSFNETIGIAVGGAVEASYTFKYVGSAVVNENDATRWTLTPDVLYVSDYSCEGAGKEKTDELFRAQFMAMFTAETVDAIMDGKKVKIPFEEDQKVPLTVTVNEEKLTFTY